MKCFVIYDETGRIYAAEYGEKTTFPNELKYLQTEFEEGSQIVKVDVSASDEHKLVYIPPKEKTLASELEEIKKSNDELQAQLTYLLMITESKTKTEV